MSLFGDLHPFPDAGPRPYLERALPPGVVRAASSFFIALFALFVAGAIWVPLPERVEGGFTLDADLVAELHVPELESARLEVGQPVRLLFAAYPYTRYGARDAQVVAVAEAVREGRVLVLAKLAVNTIVVGGKTKPLVPGLRGVARVRVGERTLLEWIVEPLSALRSNQP